MNDLLKVVISLSIEKVREMGLTEELAISDAANAITEDAMLESPITPNGQEIRAKADQIIKDKENGVESPYFPKPEFDMNALYDERVNASLKPVFETIASYTESSIGRQMTKPTPESDKARLKIMDDMSIAVFKILNESKVPLIWYGPFIEDIKNVISDLDNLMKDQVKGHMKEIMSRTIGARHPNPKNNAFNDEFATYEDLLKAREKVKEQTGGKDEDYFYKKDNTLE